MTPPPLPAKHQKRGGQQEGEPGSFQDVQGEHYQRNFLRVFMLERGLFDNPELSLVHKRSPKSINQSPNSWACPCRLHSGYFFKQTESSDLITKYK